MNIDIDQLATLVAAQLTTAAAASTFSQTFTCEFNDSPIFDQDELTDMKVTVMPVRFVPAPSKTMPGQPRAHRFRGINEYQYVISIAFMQEGPPNPSASLVDPIRAFSAGMRLLVQEVIHWLNQDENRRPQVDPAGTSLWLKTIEVPELYDVARLKADRTFKSYFNLTYEEFVRE